MTYTYFGDDGDLQDISGDDGRFTNHSLNPNCAIAATISAEVGARPP